jgi:hypothetical protein
MKHLKTLGLAAVVAAVATAICGVGTASATVLCQNNTEPCTAKYLAGTEVNITLKPGTSNELKAGFANFTCLESNLTGKTANTGSSTETVRGLPATWITSNCGSATIVVLNKGELEIHHIAGTSAGTLTTKGQEVTVMTAGVSCVYGPGATPLDLGKLTGSSENGGATATIKASASYRSSRGASSAPTPPSGRRNTSLQNPTSSTSREAEPAGNYVQGGHDEALDDVWPK